MPNPKHRLSKTRKNKRRSHHALRPTALSPCPQCSEPRLPHHVCPNCGFYNGREAVKPEEE